MTDFDFGFGLGCGLGQGLYQGVSLLHLSEYKMWFTIASVVVICCVVCLLAQYNALALPCPALLEYMRSIVAPLSRAECLLA